MMAAHLRDDILHGKGHPDDHASETRWRHEESRSYAQHAITSPREADERSGSKDLTNFLNSTRVEPSGSGVPRKPIMIAGNARTQQTLGEATQANTGTVEVKCGPLLNYRRMENDIWHGSVLIVTRGGGLGEGPPEPELRLRVLGPAQTVRAVEQEGLDGAGSEPYGVVNGVDCGGFQQPRSASSSNGVPKQETTNGGSSSEEVKVKGTKLYSDPANTFWRFDLQVPMQQFELHCEYDIPSLSFTEGKKRDKQSFFVPAISESMRIMFHSCNGFSVGTDEVAWSGPALWNDVMRVHKKTPFHVMLGGGDQIYNDGIRVKGPLRAWTDIGNPKKRRDYRFPETLRKDCDKYYADNYIRWYSTEPFASANGQIPQLNLWDDHDIIDGFGSYVDDFMRCDVFRGIGGTANKYYLLFQHHLPPPISTYTTDAPQTTSDQGAGADPRQLENTFVLQDDAIDSSYIIGSKPGPYVAEHSRSIWTRLGAKIGFVGIDARTERTRKQVNYPETYDIIFDRLRKELGAAKSSSSPIKHLIVLLGIPIAYPRLTWLENIFSSPLIAPIKFLNKRFGFGGGFFNHFDGSVDLLDDLDDHYTARTHKKERLYLVEQLQALSAEFSVRITILGGDVHLAAIGRFYSNPKLNVPVIQDHRYMANIISSAIVNKPPPQAVANLLARRNKIHHLDPNTDETLMKFFDRDPGNSNKTSGWNHVTMPSRNFAMITENHQAGTNRTTPNGHAGNGADKATDLSRQSKLKTRDGHGCLHPGEVDAGSKHKAAEIDQHGKGSDGSLDICIRVEMDQHDIEGKTRLYGMTIPVLEYSGAAENVLRKRDAIQGAFNQKF